MQERKEGRKRMKKEEKVGREGREFRETIREGGKVCGGRNRNAEKNR